MNVLSLLSTLTLLLSATAAASATIITSPLPTCPAPCPATPQTIIDKMIAYDAKTIALPTTCPRSVAQSTLPKLNNPGPFVSTAAAGQNVTMTPFGPLDDADRFLLQSVRRAGLWEQPAGQRAKTDGGCGRVGEIGEMLAADHIFLDNLTKEVADTLGVSLPDDLTPQQAQFMQEMACASQGAEWDGVFTMRLRQAHGGVFTVIAEVRGKTRNDMMRWYASQANAYVLKHMELLESTSMVRYDVLPASVVANATPDRKNLQAPSK
ncbi:hypothetical protein HDU67_009391 [Dinochytrium kinnereticum]|nr:hypothetical protein HDU67_009391 [Dinochytrium kinnereticum]